MAVMEGQLCKWTNVMKGWQYRWLVLDDNAGLLSYYTSKEKMMRGARRGCVRLKGAVIGIDDEDDSTFTITVDGKIFHFQAENADDREKWVSALEETIVRHTPSRGSYYKSWERSVLASTIQDFESKLTESDAYLQLMIEQVKNIEHKIETADETEKILLSLVRDKANCVVESVKHSIILLQIAKNTSHPVNGVYQTFKPTEVSPQPSVSSREISSESDPIKLPVVKVEEAAECKEDGGSKDVNSTTSQSSSSSMQVTTPLPQISVSCSQSVVSRPEVPELESLVAPLSTANAVSQLNQLFPETSYSSSEDDDFFDAAEDTVSSLQSPNGHRTFVDAMESLEVVPVRAVEPEPLVDTRNINNDALYEDNDEEDLGSLENQGSVISHLLSQVKIGMDLTKVVLPTFILEKRSLLEMYADFFAHPDIFVSIPDFEDPKDRMVQVLRWYLSAFHAGRKSSVAKKPYNPILGEIFRCFWEVPGFRNTQEYVVDGPIPWATKQNLTFIAEQVSHHPPISAFYAEHYEKGISCCAHIWTKSKFLGLSIGVHNIGQGCISLLKYNEEYIVTFPNGYGRSILTVPWIELGSHVSITCAQTGYSATVEFLTKPFYGGKKHRITAEVFQPNDRKPFMSVAGEWNGIMHAKWASGETEVFVDTRKIPIIRKRVKNIDEQELYESRRLWVDVTRGLKFHHVDAATEAKFSLEQQQRDEARARKETGSKWETRFFHEVGEHWVYDHPLQKRTQVNCT
ncbi:oxysterol-binding protein-related protein 9 isoform X1 [Tachypleus tridentatus]|uniref:oxysterol-binding protein-related protein 9 isoform X1 n=1 Tax=Tachypleus tridentatus TaxID=6853 RepID=UPI003FCF08F4